MPQLSSRSSRIHHYGTRFRPVILMVALLAAPATARADFITIDFEGKMPAGESTYTDRGVTFSAVSGDTIEGRENPNGTFGLIASTLPYSELRADITGGADFVSVDIGDFGGDNDLLFLEVFDASDVLLGFVSMLIDREFEGMKTLSLARPDISYAVFGARAPALSASSVYADNFTFRPLAGSAVPEPASLALVVSGLGALALRRRRITKR